ncbi:uncharacterized protein [Primulina huaijiensis]|uniref:uncharacterized protein isoform X1 n=1 Tax=Primulina huaijiensis TaxID=1492673 RepID=UPI003CC70EDD
MGNCQAIDNATLVIQHPSGKVDHLFKPVTVGEIMKMNPGHYVALLLTTTLYSSASAAGSLAAGSVKDYASRASNSNVPLRVTRIKLLRPTDTLVLGHVYRLVTTQEVMKGLGAKKLAKMKQDQQQKITGKQSSDFDAVVRRTDVEKTKQQVNHGRQKSRNNTSVNAASRHRTWQPALNSISESAS